jgi:peptidoglycan/xylan/chitin deacetylase (PgdA/CDA1 family)
MPSRLLRNRSREAVFLCYHSVAPRGPRYLSVTAELFERQLEEIARRGLRTGGEAELAEIVAGRLAAPTAILTFDDGFIDNYLTVLPLLRERQMRAFVFVLPPLVDGGAALAWPEVAADAERFPDEMRSVTWDMLGEMQEGGFVVGSHGLTHAHLPSLGGEALREELLDSRRRITDRLGSCDTVAYPFGEWSEEVARAAPECGYKFAFTLPVKTGQWRATPHTLPRINIDYRDDGKRLGAKLSPLGRRLYLSTTLGSLRVGVRRVARRG